MGRVLLTGGGGFIGGALASALRQRGETVVGFARSEQAALSLAAKGAHVVRGDVLDPKALKEALRGCELVYHVAGVNSHCPKDPQRLVRTNVEGTANVVEAAAGARVRRVVITSSAAVIGETKGTVATEHSPHRGRYLSVYERSKREAEQLAFAIGAQEGVDVLALNPSSVQGPPRSTGNGAIIIAYLNRRLRVFLDTHLSIVDIDDVVQAHLLAADLGTPGERYILNGTTVQSRQALDLLAAISGVKYTVRVIPAPFAHAGATVADAVLRPFGIRSPLCLERVETLLHGHRYDGSRATRELRLRYTPLSDTLTRTVEWARRAGLAPPGDPT